VYAPVSVQCIVYSVFLIKNVCTVLEVSMLPADKAVIYRVFSRSPNS
jgi:hypothetical protein